ncbi:MAG: DUF4160 domain-containing protein [Deltaproteobacteria bacterium]|nr:DUF4160 domain-containing protein [Deltaproteobacteria bacterium]
MPVVSSFFGIVIRMFHADHVPPHFHAEYAGWRAAVDLQTGRILRGRLPGRCGQLVEEWRAHHVAELRRAWQAAQAHKLVPRIKPLS